MMDFKAFLDNAAGNRKDNPFMMTTTDLPLYLRS